MQLSLGQRSLNLETPAVMGVLNITPDSFSDGGRYLEAGAAIDRGLEMIEEGATFIDVGGESTRPGAEPVCAREQIERVLPVIDALAGQRQAVVSVDSGEAEVIRAATDAGAALVNDVYALRRPGALEAAAATDAAVCLMHMQGSPGTMQEAPAYPDVVADVAAFLSARTRECLAAGVSRERLVVDPGFGFGKTDDHNLRLLAHLDRIVELGFPVMVGLSRKSTLGRLTGRPPPERTAAGIAAAVMAVERGARIVRTHDVAETVDALTIAACARRAVDLGDG